MNLLLDTNILIDYLGERHPYCDEWGKLEAMHELGDAELWVSSESFTDAFYLLEGAIGSEKLQSMFLTCLDFLNVCPVGEEVVYSAVERSWHDFEDCVIDVCAEHVQADCIITRDKNGFTNSRIPAMDIPGFMRHIEDEYGVVYDTIEW